MRASLATLLLAVATLCTLWAPEAHAQFANRSIGLSAGYLSLTPDAGIDQGIPISFDASLYIEGGFDFVASVPLMILREPGGRQVIGMAPSTGIRYLFSEETVRPYIEADLSYLHVFRPEGTTNFVGLGPSAGIDVFVGSSVSVGVRGVYTFYLALNTPVTSSFGALAGVKTYF